MAESILLLITAALVLLTSFMVVVTRNTIHSALWMVASFFLLAVVFIFLRLQFIAALQVIIYAGAVMMFIIFAIIMLNLRVIPGRIELRSIKTMGIVFVLFLFPALLVLIGLGPLLDSQLQGDISLAYLEKYGEVPTLAGIIFSEYLIVFELVSVLLTVGVIGAVALAMKRKE
ncbi:MAG: NADH-quinone oxidoreductase subunit J [Thermodesulfobacteriota bacterium]